jgi:GNAT superfamily N-acetyltransferase
MGVSVRPVDVAVIRPLRREILRPTRPPEASVYEQDDLADTVHLAAYDDRGGLVGCVTVFPQSYDGEPLDGDTTAYRDAWRLRGMATTPEVRGTGVGRALLLAAIDAVAASGARLLWCHARAAAEGFYAKHGFVAVGVLFEIPVAGQHRLMRLALPVS